MSNRLEEADQTGINLSTPLFPALLYPANIMKCPTPAFIFNFVISVLLALVIGQVTGDGIQTELVPFFLVPLHALWAFLYIRDPFIWRSFSVHLLTGRPWPGFRRTRHDASHGDDCVLAP